MKDRGSDGKITLAPLVVGSLEKVRQVKSLGGFRYYSELRRIRKCCLMDAEYFFF